MTSKNSFWASLIENNKRRIPEWMLSIFAFGLVLPGYTIMNISKFTVTVNNYAGENMSEEYLHRMLCDGVSEAIGFSVLIKVLTIFFAWFTAMFGFSYLFSKQQTDFYLGMPVKKRRRFGIIWINGIIIFLIPYLTGLCISLGIAAGNGALNSSVITHATVTFLCVLLFYLCIYHISIFTVMLTGNRAIQIILFAFTFVYEILPRLTLQSFKTQFYTNYLREPSSDLLATPLYMFNGIEENYLSKGIVEWNYILEILTIAAVMILVSYFCYKKRPAESVGKAIVFPILKPIIKIFITVLFAMMAGAATMYAIDFKFVYSDTGIGYVIFVMVITVIAGCGMFQIVYEADGKGFLHKKKHMLISGLIVTVLFLIFRFDLTRFDAYIPEENEIASVAFVPVECELYMDGDANYLNERGEQISILAYVDNYMYLTDTKTIHELAEYSSNAFKEETKESLKDYDRDRWVETAIIYRLKNDKKVYRKLWIDTKDQKTMELMDKIVGTQEFGKGYFYVLSPMMQEMLDSDKYSIDVSYNDRKSLRHIQTAYLKNLLDSFEKDISTLDYQTLRINHADRGIVVLIRKSTNDSQKDYGFAGVVGFNIFPNFQHTIQTLDSKGYLR